MNSAIIVVLVLLWGADSRPIRQDVLAGEDFLAFLMRSHRPRSQQNYFTTATSTTTTAQTTTAVTTEPSTIAQTETDTVPTTLETEPPSVVSVRVSSSVRKEAVHEVPNVLAAAAQRSHFSVESSGYREESGEKNKIVEDSLAEATQDFPSAHDQEIKGEDKKPYAEALTLEESGLGYETRVSSETSHSRVYFSQPKPVSQSVVVQTSQQTRKYEPTIVVTQSREERKYIPHAIHHNKDHKYQEEPIVREERHYPTDQPSAATAAGQQIAEQIQQIIQQTHEVNVHQEQPEKNYESPPPDLPREQRHYEHQEQRHYEQPEQNYEVDEAISVMSNGRAHGVQTEGPPNNKFGLVQEGRNYRKYRVEEKTPDGFIVGEYGVVSHDDGGVRGVRYTADGSISPRLIYEALVKFLSLK